MGGSFKSFDLPRGMGWLDTEIEQKNGIKVFSNTNHNYVKNQVFNVETAIEVAKKTVNKVSCNLDDYMFMYVTDDFKLAFKHQLTREYVFIDYV